MSESLVLVSGEETNFAGTFVSLRFSKVFNTLTNELDKQELVSGVKLETNYTWLRGICII